ncbi:hypothetical protein Tco_0747927 [Tanacetum coccineum]|uniref:Reverse transcriptase/retrotransposon-derived protein RNase H-like domain-containing protein n=1 Tax=Tanacetum coccineum TaxID=301880 RepID=A0ABQ4YVB1_9ASTR
MAPKRTTRSTPITPTPNATPTQAVTELNFRPLINQGVIAAMAKQKQARTSLDGLEKMESVFSISTGQHYCQVKLRTYTLQAIDLTWLESSCTASGVDLQKIRLRCGYLSVKASKPKTMQEAIEFTTELMDEKTHAYAERQAEKKRRYDDLSKNNQNQQQQNKRQNTGQAYTAGNSDRKSTRDILEDTAQTEKPMDPCFTILALPEGSEDFIAYCDASKKGLGAVLMQREKCSLSRFGGTIYTEPGVQCSLITRAYSHILDQIGGKNENTFKSFRALVMTIRLEPSQT